MFGIFYSLIMGCVHGIGNFKEEVDKAESKRKYYDYETDTYIDHRGCTRDYKTDEPRLVTSQWNKEKGRYERIVLRNGKIIRNIEDEQDKQRESADWKVKVFPNDNEYSQHEFKRNDGHSGMVKGILYKTKMDNEYIVKREFRIHKSAENIEKYNVWFMIGKFKVLKIESSSVKDYYWKEKIRLINDSIIKDGNGSNGEDCKKQYDNWYNDGGDIWLYSKNNENETIIKMKNQEKTEDMLQKEKDKELEKYIIKSMYGMI